MAQNSITWLLNPQTDNYSLPLFLKPPKNLKRTYFSLSLTYANQPFTTQFQKIYVLFDGALINKSPHISTDVRTFEIKVGSNQSNIDLYFHFLSGFALAISATEVIE
ncbi:MAG: hypothetical protein BWK75_04695 [Candidatus Altiarchaeales archaeon A3]|nr:MAG: hypothetical protein BWK75_04695 [Candidatus Altiarchaeales archaeon A3]